MYDEATRQQDHYWASLTYAQEEGIRQGIEQGIEQAVITLMKNSYISAEVAAAQLKVNIEDLDKYL